MNKYIPIILVSLIGLIIRFWAFGDIPPSLKEVYTTRVYSALSSSLSVILIYLLVRKVFNKHAAFFSSLALAILPLSIAEGRITSWVSLLIFFIILSYLLLTNKGFFIKLVGSVILVIPLIYFRSEFVLPTSLNFDKLISNIFDLISFDKIFFANDTYWIAGLRDYGMVFPETIPLFLLGLREIVERRKITLITYGFLVIIISAMNPNYPESRSAGLLIPLIAIILGLGSDKLYKWIIKGKSWLKIIALGVYLLLLVYGVLNFFHYYFSHYNLRIKQDNLYQINKF